MKLTKTKLKQLIKEELNSLISENIDDLEDEAVVIQKFWFRGQKMLEKMCDDGTWGRNFPITCQPVKILAQALRQHPFVKARESLKGRRVPPGAIKDFITLFKPEREVLSQDVLLPVVERVVASRLGRRIAKRLKRTVGSP